MTRQGQERPITVGVEGGQHAVLSFAAVQARSIGCDLRIVHAYVVPPRPPAGLAGAYGIDVAGSFREAGRAVLLDAAAFLAAVHGDVVVQQVLTRGRPVPVLHDLADTSRLVVLGPDDDRRWYSRLFQSRVSGALVEAAPCPVVVVPGSWVRSDTDGDVTLLLDARTVAHGPLRFGFDHARRNHAVLHVIHLEVPDAVEGDGVPWHDMSRLVDSWGARYPEVLTDVRVIRGEADLEMVESLETSGLLVMGMTHDLHLVPALHRSLARSVIRHADCPIAVVPAHYDG